MLTAFISMRLRADWLPRLRKLPLSFVLALVLCVSLPVIRSFGLLDSSRAAACLEVLSKESSVYAQVKVLGLPKKLTSAYGKSSERYLAMVQKLWGHDFAVLAMDKPFKAFIYGLEKDNELITPGRILWLKGQWKTYESPRVLGQFDERSYRWVSQVKGKIFQDASSRVYDKGIGRQSIIEKSLWSIREYIHRKIDRGFIPLHAGFLKALIVGDKEHLDTKVRSLFAGTGAAHLLAVSGFHVGFVMTLLFGVLRLARLPKQLQYVVALGGVWVYCAVVGFHAPVFRATVMVSIWLLSRCVGRPMLPLNALGWACVVILCAAPRQLWDIGFQLSFACVLAITLWFSRFQRYEEADFQQRGLWVSVWRYVQAIVLISAICFFASAPLTQYYFYELPIYSILTNVMAVPLSFIIFVLTALMIALPDAWHGLQALVLVADKTFIQTLFVVLSAIERQPLAIISVGAMPVVVCIVWAVCVWWAVFTSLIRATWVRWATMILVSVVAIGGYKAIKLCDEAIHVSMMDVGQGDSLLIYNSAHKILVDTGTPDAFDFRVRPFLIYLGGRKLDALMLSHPQNDHIGGLKRLLDDFHVERVFTLPWRHEGVVYDHYQELIKGYDGDLVGVRPGVKSVLCRDLVASFIYPDARDMNAPINDQSMMAYVDIYRSSLFLSGDGQEKAFRNLLGHQMPNRRASILKVPHHGAKMTEATKRFIHTLRPGVALISAGVDNIYKHPHADTVHFLKSECQSIYLTSEVGQIILSVSKASADQASDLISVETVYKP